MRLSRAITVAGVFLGSVLPAGESSPCDAAFRLRRDPVKAKEALVCYREVLAKNPESAEAGWHVAMACQYLGHRLAKDDDEKLALFGEGRDVASAAAKKDPACGPCHFWAGINRALYGQTSGIFRTIATLGVVRENLERAAEIDATYAYGGPDRILGLINEKVPGILGGSNRDAEAHFEKAIAAAPQNPLNYLFLAKFFRETLEDDGKYRATMERAKQKVVAPAPDDVESFEAWQEMAEWGRRLSSKKVSDASEGMER